MADSFPLDTLSPHSPTRSPERIPYSEASLWRMEKRGEFPAAVKLSARGRAVGYFEDQVEEWIRSRGPAAA